MVVPKFVTLLLTALAVICVGGQTPTECPQPVNCIRNPCDGARCPRFLNTECRADFCHGECRATFFLSNGKEVTSRCPVEMCDQKQCAGNRTCVEEVLPANCPADRPNCRQYIKARCILPITPPPVMNCSFVVCPPRTVCIVRETRVGPRPRCVPPPPPSSCDQLDCDEGMECFEREREGLPSVVRCVPITVSPIPRDCSEVECPDGFVCMVTNNRAICVVIPPPRNCNELECGIGQECREVPANLGSSTRPLCITVTVVGVTCQELNCEESFSTCRTMSMENLTIPEIVEMSVCVPTANCSLIEAQCQQQGRVCEVQGEGDTAIAVCVQPTTCERLVCNPGFECVVFMFNSTTCPVTVEPRSPMPIFPIPTIPPGLPQLSIAICFPSLIRSSCEELDCRDNQSCTFIGYPARNVSLAYCIDQPTCSNTNPCLGGGIEICVDMAQLGTTCLLINCFENGTQCPRGSTCRDVPDELESIADFDSHCIPDVSNFELGAGGCGERVCNEEEVCQGVEFEGTLVGTTCIGQQQPTTPTPLPQQPTCNSTNPCLEGVEICVDIAEIGTICLLINCFENGTQCPPGSTCRDVPDELENIAYFDSHCIPDVSNFELGVGGCGERVCNEEEVCRGVEFEGTLVGTTCIGQQQPTMPTPLPQQPTCNSTNPCLEGVEICVDIAEIGTICLLINCFENGTQCPPGSTCRDVPDELENIAYFDSHCIPDVSNFELGVGGCGERVCNEEEVCRGVEFEGTLVGTTCIGQQQPTMPTPLPQQPTCNSTNPCLEGVEICVDIAEIGTICLLINCFENGTQCPPDSTCRDVPDELESIADFDSHCIPDVSNFELGVGGCGERVCNEEEVCRGVEFEGTLVGTTCIGQQQPTTPTPLPTPFPQPGDCLNCRDEECVRTQIGNGPPTAQCICSTTATQTIEPIQLPQSTLCEEVECSRSFECRVIVREDGFPIVAPVCVPVADCSQLEAHCAQQGLVCEIQGEGSEATAVCVTPSVCAGVVCLPGLECMEFTFEIATLQQCPSIAPTTTMSPFTPTMTPFTPTMTPFTPTMTPFTPTMTTIATPTIDPTVGPTPSFITIPNCYPSVTRFTCEELDCPENQVCVSTAYPSRNLSIAYCVEIPGLGGSCNSTLSCFGDMEVCVDIKQDGSQFGISCNTINCLGNNTMCAPGSSCNTVPDELEFADYDSVCVQDSVNFEFGGGCEERACGDSRLICQEVEFEGTVVGTICNARPNTDCDSVECLEGQECQRSQVGLLPSVICACTSALTETLEQVDLPSPDSLCSELDCDESLGLECRVIVREQGYPVVVPSCVPTSAPSEVLPE